MILPDLSSEISFKTSRSGGAGGQHVNKVSSKVELSFPISTSRAFNDEQKNRLLEKLAGKLTSEGVLLIIAQAERSQLKNKEIALAKLYAALEKALHVPKKRKPTKASKSSVEKRLSSKKKAGEIKRLRRGDF